ncbi:MAG: CRISPR-associated helicase Cas3' [Nanopusillaceae archaeon]
MGSIICNGRSHPGKLLREHIEEIQRIINDREIIEKYLINEDYRLLDLINLVAKYHDIGKCKKKFQNYIKEIEEGKKPSKPGNHAVWSLEGLRRLLCEKNKDIIRELSKLNYEERFLLYYLVLKHHSNFTVYFQNSREILNDLLDLDIMRFKDLLQTEDKFEIAKILGKRKYKNDSLELTYTELLKVILKKLGKKYLINLADLYGLFKFADSISAQGKFNEYKNYFKSIKIIDDDIKNIIGNNIDLERYNKQSLLSNYNYLFLRAPTGWGKTSTALLFAKNKNYNRIFFTLPTITSIKDFYEKLEDIYCNNVSMYFYLYDAHLLSENENDIVDERIANLFYIQNMYSPINITTVDQIILSFLQAGRYFLKRVNFRNSIIILDEIHLLTPRMIFLLKKILQHFADLYKFKLLFMSATLPKGLYEYITDGLNIKFEVKDIYGRLDKSFYEEKYYNRVRLSIELIEKDILEDIDQIAKEYEKNKKVLVILNTVEKSVALYEKLKETYNIPNDKILLLHARHTFKDREEKEDRIREIEKKGGIFIATQIAEVSLDIDYDILFTELAPLSSIIQRSGRVNRYGNKEKSKVYVYMPAELEKIKEDKKYPYEYEELERTLKVLKEINQSSRDLIEGKIIEKIDENLNYDFYRKLIEEENKDFVNIYEDAFENIDREGNLLWFLSSTLSEKNIMNLLDFRGESSILTLLSEDIINDKDLKEKINSIINEYQRLKDQNAGYREWREFFGELKRYLVPIPLWIVARAMKSSNSSEIKRIGFPILESLPEDMDKYKYFKEYGFVNLTKLEKYGVFIDYDDDNIY